MEKLVYSPWFNASLLAGLLFLLMGLLIRRFPPKSTKAWYGYRTFLSTQNKEMWDSANQYAAWFSRRAGIALLLIGLMMGYIFKKQTDLFLYLTIGPVIISALLMAGYTEWYLHETFDEEGHRRERK
ncbi:SdpI family protein [Chitinophaga sedimenti]|uniref:SdpI family protein n=1 Tax=Chitinophaga sedimenti TaxID=2033606 RepID=UPI00200479E9|nr:SdpI family protein [Chitinophaga sedimenti]MCK7556922.1 SdpI family protein [Chitinophaga sedimenti]